jgi:acyl-CoA oxidase
VLKNKIKKGIQYLFKQAMSIQSTPEQYAQWKDDIENWGLFGCFAMTELGTSSYLRGLETTATYDKETQSFIINTPTTTATKWWIGAAGHTATHAVVLANLYIDGNAKGLHWFVVQLRDKKTGTLMPGVAAGLVGPKAGRAGIDNGWIQFDSVVIPRMNMLMRFNQVSPSGEYSAGGNPAIAYASLIGERIFLVRNQARDLPIFVLAHFCPLPQLDIRCLHPCSPGSYNRGSIWSGAKTRPEQRKVA